MNKKFTAQCDREIVRNNAKGDWNKYSPNIKEFTQELVWHEAKFHAALLSGDIMKIKEHACDIANLCEKAFTSASLADDTREILYDHYGDFIGYKYPKGVGFNVGEYK